eukprot:COSAG02_NODE_3239_length_7114_cov_295.628938_6_plen_175_part_00
MPVDARRLQLTASQPGDTADTKMASKFLTGVIGGAIDEPATPLPLTQVDADGKTKGSNFAYKRADTPHRDSTKIQREIDIKITEAKIKELEAQDQLTDEDHRRMAECRDIIDKAREYLKMAENVDKQLLQAKAAQREADAAEAQLQHSEEMSQLAREHEKKLSMQRLQDEHLLR